MLQIRPDISKNRLYIKIAGKVNKKELDKLYTDIRFSVADLAAGFDVVSDFSECSLVNLNGLPTFRKINNYLVSKGVGNVVRILPQKELIFNQIMNLASRVQGYKPTYVSSLEEAEEHLASAAKRSGIRIHLHFHQIEYTVDGEKGQGSIIDISTSGCGVQSVALPPSENVEMTVLFSLQKQEHVSETFKIKAKVVWVNETSFGVEFKGLDEHRQGVLWQCLAYESQQSINT